MAHNLTIRADGTAEMFSLRESPWHKLGRVLPEEITDGKVLEMAGLNWAVEEVPVGTVDQVAIPGGDTMTTATVIPGWKALRRNDTGAVLGVVGKHFRTYQNQELVDLMRRIAGLGHIVWETAGSLGGGKTVWALARLPDLAWDVKGDANNAYMLLTNGHGNQRALTIMPTAIRVVCANTMRMATGGTAATKARILNMKEGDFSNGALATGYGLHHDRGLDDAVRQVVAAYRRLTEAQEATAALGNRLADAKVNQADADAYWEMTFRLAVPAGLDEKAKVRAMRKRDGTLGKLREIMAGPTCQVAGTAGTWYAAAQAALELIDHHPGKNSTAGGRFGWANWGDGAALKADAWAYALAAV